MQTQTLPSLAGELSAMRLQTLPAPSSDREWSEFRAKQDEILDECWLDAAKQLSDGLDPEPAPAMQEQFVRIGVEWDEADAPFGTEPPNRYVLVPKDVADSSLQDESILAEWLYERYHWTVEVWWFQP